MPPFQYVYELRRGEEVVATGRTTPEEPVEIGDRVTLGGREGIVRSVEPVAGSMSCDWFSNSSRRASRSSWDSLLAQDPNRSSCRK
jgi:hypothetical protein